jgi:hypothetical protein
MKFGNAVYVTTLTWGLPAKFTLLPFLSVIPRVVRYRHGAITEVLAKFQLYH